MPTGRTQIEQFDLTGKTVLITGGSRGIGRAIAEACASCGAKVMVSARSSKSCEDVVATIRAKGGTVMACPALISNEMQIETLVKTTRQEFGKIDVLVCCAAINPQYGPLENVSDEMFDRMMTNNVLSTLRLSRLVLDDMRIQGEGSIIFISSLAELRASVSLGMYGITKAANSAMCRNLAAEWGPLNIRVNCIAPGLIETDFSRSLVEDPNRRARREQATPLRRLGQPSDIAGVAVMLAAPAGAYITGQTIVVDGGVSITA